MSHQPPQGPYYPPGQYPPQRPLYGYEEPAQWTYGSPPQDPLQGQSQHPQYPPPDEQYYAPLVQRKRDGKGKVAVFASGFASGFVVLLVAVLVMRAVGSSGTSAGIIGTTPSASPVLAAQLQPIQITAQAAGTANAQAFATQTAEARPPTPIPVRIDPTSTSFTQPVAVSTMVPSITDTTNAPIRIEGHGQMATAPVSIPYPVALIHVKQVGGEFEVLDSINSHGVRKNLFLLRGYRVVNYEGTLPLFTADTYIFNVSSKGNWTITITPISAQLGVAFMGKGDAVSGYLDPVNGTKIVTFTHDGLQGFYITLYCDGQRAGGASGTGSIKGSQAMTFPPVSRGCFWAVVGDGSWTIKVDQ